MTSKLDLDMKYVDISTTEWIKDVSTLPVKERLKIKMFCARKGLTLEQLARGHNSKMSQKSSYHTTKLSKKMNDKNVLGLVDCDIREELGLEGIKMKK